MELDFNRKQYLYRFRNPNGKLYQCMSGSDGPWRVDRSKDVERANAQLAADKVDEEYRTQYATRVAKENAMTERLIASEKRREEESRVTRAAQKIKAEQLKALGGAIEGPPVEYVSLGTVPSAYQWVHEWGSAAPVEPEKAGEGVKTQGLVNVKTSREPKQETPTAKEVSNRNNPICVFGANNRMFTRRTAPKVKHVVSAPVKEAAVDRDPVTSAPWFTTYPRVVRKPPVKTSVEVLTLAGSPAHGGRTIYSMITVPPKPISELSRVKVMFVEPDSENDERSDELQSTLGEYPKSASTAKVVGRVPGVTPGPLPELCGPGHKTGSRKTVTFKL